MVGILFRQNMHLDVYGVLYTPELCRLGQLALAQYNIFGEVGDASWQYDLYSFFF